MLGNFFLTHVGPNRMDTSGRAIVSSVMYSMVGHSYVHTARNASGLDNDCARNPQCLRPVLTPDILLLVLACTS